MFSAIEAPESFSLASDIYYAQFDHSYDNVYYELINELPAEKKKLLLTLAIQAPNQYNFFTSSLIMELASFGDINTGQYIERWTTIPDKKDPIPQIVISNFVVSHIALGKMCYQLPLKTFSHQQYENTMLACVEIYYWMSRPDLTNIEIYKKTKVAWNILSEKNAVFSLTAIKSCERVLLEGIDRLLGKGSNSISIIENNPCEISKICRDAISNRENQQINDLIWIRQKDIIIYAIQILGKFGTPNDIRFLRDLVDHPDYGSTAIDSIQNIDAVRS